MIEHGDIVTWSSQAAGSAKDKTGIVVEVVPIGGRPSRLRWPQLYKGAGVGFGRDHVSFVVEVPPPPGSSASPKHYWPRVSGLKKVG